MRLVDADVTPPEACRDHSRRAFLGAASHLRAAIRRPASSTSASGPIRTTACRIDDMIVQLKRLEIREIEMSRGEFMLFSKPKPEQFAVARKRSSTRPASGASPTTPRPSMTMPIWTPPFSGARLARVAKYHRRRNRRYPAAHRRALHAGRPDLRNPQSLLQGKKFAYESPEDVLRGAGGPLQDDGSLARHGPLSPPADTIRWTPSANSRRI